MPPVPEGSGREVSSLASGDGRGPPGGTTEEVTSCRHTSGLRHLPSETGVSVADRISIIAQCTALREGSRCQGVTRHRIVKMLTRSFVAGRMGAPEYLSLKGPCELLQRSPGCDDRGRPQLGSPPTGGAVVRVVEAVGTAPAFDLAQSGSWDRGVRSLRDWRSLAALVPSTRSARRNGANDLTICTPSFDSPGIGRGGRIEERRDQ
jgi:hypothetical protein